MLMPDQVLVYGDCAINPDPTAEELAEIAIQSADSAAAFGIEPRVAMISYSTGASGSGEDVDKVRKATDIVRERRPDIVIDGPIQYDAASVESVGQQKAPSSPLGGHANVFIFPDLNTGNTTYKAVQRSAGVVSVGPMLQGLRKPVNDLSRGALVDDIVYTIALTAIQARPRTPRRKSRIPRTPPRAAEAARRGRRSRRRIGRHLLAPRRSGANNKQSPILLVGTELLFVVSITKPEIPLTGHVETLRYALRLRGHPLDRDVLGWLGFEPWPT